MKYLLLIATATLSMHAMQPEELFHVLPHFDGTMGIHACTINNDREISINADEFFPMASVRKIPFACFLFDQKNLDLDRQIEITSEDLVAGTGTIKNEVTQDKPKSYSVKELMKLMLCVSDNTATHKLMTLNGGYEAVDAWLAKNNVKNIHFRTTGPDWLKAHAMKTLAYKATQQAILSSPQAPQSLKDLAVAFSQQPEPGTISFDHETTNIATPKAMNQFIMQCYQGTAPGLSNPEHRDLLFSWMAKCELGKNRMPLHLPDADVSHKTGSGFVGICNDAGSIESKEKEPVIMTIFLKNSVKPMKELEEVIAKATCIIYDQL